MWEKQFPEAAMMREKQNVGQVGVIWNQAHLASNSDHVS